ncbi:MAG TPA: hypothetical protein VNM14_24475 [Planctomycetota bacterium]|nr:hypothetical protein [Planctomycetota bacterium]
MAIVVGAGSCLVAVVALAAGLLYCSTSLKLGALLLGIGAVAMEGGVHLLRRSRDPKVLAFSSPIVSGAIALLALSLGIYAAGLAAARTPLDEPAWLTPALYAGAAACGWIGLRAGWSAISGARKPPAA